MAQPADLAAWSTDANFTSGPETGSATKVDPGAAYEAQGLVPGGTFVGPYVNWALNNHYLWLLYLKNIDTDPYFLGRTYGWTGTHVWGALGSFSAGLNVSGTLSVAGGNITLSNTGSRDATFASPRSTTRVLGFAGHAGTSANVAHISIASGILSFDCGFAVSYEMPIDLPDGCTLTGLTLRCDEGSATTNHANIKLYRKASNSAPIQVGSTGTHSGGAGYDTLTIGAPAHVVTRSTHTYFLAITGSDAVTGVDLFTDVIVTFTDPGSLAAR